MVVVVDNEDLARRRRRLGLSQQDVADLLCGFDPGNPNDRAKGFNFSSVSRFETGDRDSMPPARRGEPRLTRSDYEALLDRLERERGGA